MKEREALKARNDNIRRLVAVGFSAKHICGIYGFKDTKRIGEICRDYDIDPPEDPIISFEEAAWLLDANQKTVRALAGILALEWGSSGPPIATCGITRGPFRDYLYKSHVDAIKGKWASVATAAKLTGVSAAYIYKNLTPDSTTYYRDKTGLIEHYTAYVRGTRPLRIDGEGPLGHIVNVESLRQFLKGEAAEEEETAEEEQPSGFRLLVMKGPMPSCAVWHEEGEVVAEAPYTLVGLIAFGNQRLFEFAARKNVSGQPEVHVRIAPEAKEEE